MRTDSCKEMSTYLGVHRILEKIETHSVVFIKLDSGHKTSVMSLVSTSGTYVKLFLDNSEKSTLRSNLSSNKVSSTPCNVARCSVFTKFRQQLIVVALGIASVVADVLCYGHYLLYCQQYSHFGFSCVCQKILVGGWKRRRR
jgi:hypothetical protein